MKRRSFLSVAVGLLAAPFVCLRKPKAKARVLDAIGGYYFHPPLKRIDIDWYRIEQDPPGTTESSAVEPSEIAFATAFAAAFWLCPTHVHIRYRINGDKWQEKEGSLPLRLCEDMSLVVAHGAVRIMWDLPHAWIRCREPRSDEKKLT